MANNNLEDMDFDLDNIQIEDGDIQFEDDEQLDDGDIQFEDDEQSGEEDIQFEDDEQVDIDAGQFEDDEPISGESIKLDNEDIQLDDEDIQLDDGDVQLDDGDVQLDDVQMDEQIEDNLSEGEDASDIDGVSNEDDIDLPGDLDLLLSDEEINRQIAELEAQLSESSETKDDTGPVNEDVDVDNTDSELTTGADELGSVVDNSALLDSDDDVMTVSKDAEFLSPTGEIVVMDPTDDETNFRLVYVDIENITIVKRIRNTNNVEDLIKSIKSTGLLKPVDVAPTSAKGYYILLDGYRRVLACARAGKRRIPCVVNTRVSVPDIPILEAMYNHSKKYSIKEMIEYIDYLEKQKGIMSASMIEYLLQLNSGDYTKLKDILNDNDEDIVSKLMQGTYTIDQAFKKLEQRRKKESAEEKELKRASKVYDEGESEEVEHIADSGEMGDENVALTDNELRQLAITASDLENVDDESLDDLINDGNSIEGFEPHKQDPKYRERLDPALRKSVLARDNNTCQICEIASGMEFVEVLDVHHIQEVYLGGTDDINNLITACTVCHKLIHLHGRGELQMRPIEELSESEQRRFKRIIKLGNKIRVDMKMKGMKLEQLKKVDNTSTIGRTKPGTGQVAG